MNEQEDFGFVQAVEFCTVHQRKRCLRQWLNFHQSIKVQRRQDQAWNYRCVLFRQRRALISWIAFVQRKKAPKEMNKTAADLRHYLILLNAWSSWVSTHNLSQRHRALLQRADQHYITSLLQRFFRLWSSLRAETANSHETLRTAIAFHSASIQRLCFVAWKRYRDCRKEKHRLNALAEGLAARIVPRHVFRRWRAFMEIEQSQRSGVGLFLTTAVSFFSLSCAAFSGHQPHWFFCLSS